METRSRNPLPNRLPGAVCAQYVVRAEKRHGPYWYRFYRERGRLRKVYVRPDDLEQIEKAIEPPAEDKA